jgi:hypothetical protein
MMKKLKEKPSEYEESEIFCYEDFEFLITHINQNADGDTERLIDHKQCLLEFYFLILCGEYDLANKLIEQSYANVIKDILNQMFIGDEHNLLEHILMNTEIVKDAIECALRRQLDGVA